MFSRFFTVNTGGALLQRTATWAVALVTVLCGAPHALAQESSSAPIVIGDRVTIHSKVLDEERALWVYRPPRYELTDTRYPVMVLLDGAAHFHHATGIVQFLSGLNRMPQMIVVGVPNTDRLRDLTFETQGDIAAQFPNTGGADDFLEFIDSELIPYIDEHYRTDPYRVLVGHSFGGMFAVHALTRKPDAFAAYLALSPALWWDNGSLLGRTDDLLAREEALAKFLFVAIGNEAGDIMASTESFVEMLKKKAPSTFEWEFEVLPGETHGSIPHRAIYLGLERLYRGWRIPSLQDLVEREGIAGIDRHYEALSGRYGYNIRAPEGIVNNVAYWYLGRGHAATAVEIFKRNAQDFPSSANVYDSLGDGYDAAGQLILARHNYEKAVTIAETTNHPNLQIYRANLERIEKRIREEEPDS